MWFLFSICAILCWSGSDLFSKMGSRPTDKLSHWKMVCAVGAVMGAHALWLLFVDKTPYDLRSLLIYLPVSALYIISMIFGYVGLRYIELSVSSPICNSSGALVTILCYFVLKQTMTGMQLFAVALICAGVFLLGVLEKRAADHDRALGELAPPRKYTRSLKAILFPILYCVLDALGTFADTFVLDIYLDETSANISYELTFLLCAVVAFIYVVFVKKDRFTVKDDKWKGVAALCETAGQFAYIFAIGANAIVAAPAIASYSIFSVLWSRIFLKEKLTKSQYAVIALVLVGIVILGIFDV